MKTARFAKPLLLLTAALASACGDSHGRGDPRDAGPLIDAIHIQADVRPIDTAVADVAVGIDTSIARDGAVASCAESYPESAFVRDGLADLRTAAVGRSLIRLPLIGPAPQPEPGPNPGVPFFVPCSTEAGVGFAWDGQRCRAVRESYCRSQGCAEIYTLESDCRTAHRLCQPELCRSTDGIWTEVPVTCGGWTCGVPAGLPGTSDCDGPPRPQCACPMGFNFTDLGCLRSRSVCPVSEEQQGCIAGNGVWRAESSNCGNWRCGERPTCEAIIPGCDCGPLRTFNTATRRCEVSPLCTGNSSREDELCRWSGGTWVQSTCGHFQCGRPSLSTCALGGCNCGTYGMFDSVQGCMLAPLCRTNACF